LRARGFSVLALAALVRILTASGFKQSRLSRRFNNSARRRRGYRGNRVRVLALNASAQALLRYGIRFAETTRARLTLPSSITVPRSIDFP
jgi:hypothetical protein